MSLDEKKSMESFYGDRYRKQIKKTEKNCGAHFDFLECMRDIFDIQNERIVTKHIASDGTLKDLPELAGCEDQLK